MAETDYRLQLEAIDGTPIVDIKPVLPESVDA
jgi:tRNA (Thr-GGU) A37 N-methylase